MRRHRAGGGVGRAGGGPSAKSPSRRPRAHRAEAALPARLFRDEQKRIDRQAHGLDLVNAPVKAEHQRQAYDEYAERTREHRATRRLLHHRLHGTRPPARIARTAALSFGQCTKW